MFKQLAIAATVTSKISSLHGVAQVVFSLSTPFSVKRLISSLE